MTEGLIYRMQHKCPMILLSLSFTPSSDFGEPTPCLAMDNFDVASINTRVPFLGFMFGSMLSQTFGVQSGFWNNGHRLFGVTLLQAYQYFLSYGSDPRSRKATVGRFLFLEYSYLLLLKVLIVWYVHNCPVVLSVSLHSNDSSFSFLDCLHFTFSAIMMSVAYTSQAKFEDSNVIWSARFSLNVDSQTKRRRCS